METDIKLWDKAPLLINEAQGPTLTYYKATNKTTRGTALILPGGAYHHLAEHEGWGYAMYLNSLGMDAFVLKYRVAPHRFPTPLLDARRAMRVIREGADLFGIDKDRIAVMGSSAGGHLAALLSTYRQTIPEEINDETDEISPYPNGQILCYPVIDKEGHLGSFDNLLGEDLDTGWPSVTPYLIADENTPPAFIWHTSSDKSVNVTNTYKYAMRLRELNIPTEMHIYPIHGHGLGLARDCEYISGWSGLLAKWLKLYEFL